MKQTKSYETPKLAVLSVSATDVLTASGPTLTPGENELPYRPFGSLLGDEDSDLLSR